MCLLDGTGGKFDLESRVRLEGQPLTHVVDWILAVGMLVLDIFEFLARKVELLPEVREHLRFVSHKL